MVGFLVLLCYFLFLPALVVPVLWGVWLLCMKIKRRSCLNPFSVIDFITPIVTVLIWGGIDAYFFGVHKRMGNFIELIGLGGIWALLILLRLFVLFVSPCKKKWPFALWANLCVIILSVICAFAIPATIE